MPIFFGSKQIDMRYNWYAGYYVSDYIAPHYVDEGYVL